MIQYFNLIKTVKNARLWVKLSAIVALMVLPFVSLLYLFLVSTQQAVTVARHEARGVEYLGPLRELMTKIPLHRGWMTIPEIRDSITKDQREGLEGEIDAELQKLKTLDARLGTMLESTQYFQAIEQQWQDLQKRGASLSLPESFAQHTQIIGQVIQLIEHVGNASELLLDPEASTYHLMVLTIHNFPDMLESLGVLRGTGTGVAANQVITIDEQARIVVLLDRLRKDIDTLKLSLTRASSARPELAKSLGGLEKQVVEAHEKFASASQEQFLKADYINIAPVEYFQQGEKVSEQVGEMYRATMQDLNRLLSERIQALQRQRLTQLALALTLALLALGVAYWINRLISGQVQSLSSLFDAIGIGNYEARAAVVSEDELGRMTGQLNTMIDSILSLNRSVEEERDALQGSIMKLLEEVADVANGDLTVQAEVTADATGAIADSFNYMITQLREVVTRVQDATLQVSASANEIQTTAEHLADGSESQAAQIVDSSAAIDEMTVSIQQVSDNASSSANVAEQALANAKQGTQAVQNTIEGMGRIREQVQETAKRIKRLGERSQEIGEIVQLIGDIADRTSILALNASIQAARAGEAGRAFVVVAEEVERLAERSSQATKQIAGLVNTIQSETNEAVTAMEESTREVVGGSRLADQAGQALVEIEGVSNRLAELLQSISLASRQQARGSEGLSKAMGEISEVTQQTAAGTKQAAVSINNLALLADELRQSVSTFKLPSNGQRP